MVPNWIIGVLLAALASIVSNLGLNLQKLNHILNAQRIRHQMRQERKSAARAAATTGGDGSSSVLTGQGQMEHGRSNSGNESGLRSEVELGVAGSKILSDSQEAAAAAASTGSVTRAHDQCSTPVSYHGDESPMESVPLSTSFHTKPPYPSAVPPSHMDAHVPRVDTSPGHVSMAAAIAARKLEAAQRLDAIDYSKQRLWRIGICLVVLGSVFDFVALIFAAQSIVAPLGSLTLVSNTLLAPLLLGENIGPRDVAATAAIVIGSSLAVIFADHRDSVFPFDELLTFFSTPHFIVYMMVVAFAIFGLAYWKRYLTFMATTEPQRYVAERLASAHRFTYAALAGIMGAQSVLAAKCTGEILVDVLQGRFAVVLSDPRCYLIVICMFLTIFLQIRWLNEGLKSFEAVYVVPVFQSFWILVSVVAGMVFFNEYKMVFNDPASSIFFPMGVLITIAGVYVLSQRGGAGGGSGSGGGTGGDAFSSLKSTPRHRYPSWFAHHFSHSGTPLTPSPALGPLMSDRSRSASFNTFESMGGSMQLPASLSASPLATQPHPALASEHSHLLASEHPFGRKVAIPDIGEDEDDEEAHLLRDTSPAPPLGFMSAPFIDTRSLQHSRSTLSHSILAHSPLLHPSNPHPYARYRQYNSLQSRTLLTLQPPPSATYARTPTQPSHPLVCSITPRPQPTSSLSTSSLTQQTTHGSGSLERARSGGGGVWTESSSSLPKSMSMGGTIGLNNQRCDPAAVTLPPVSSLPPPVPTRVVDAIDEADIVNDASASPAEQSGKERADEHKGKIKTRNTQAGGKDRR